MKRIIFLFVITTIVLNHVCAQGNFSAGANSILETYQNATGISYGLTIENQFLKHWGYETGLFLKSIILPYYNINLQYATIPVLFKFYSKVVNVSMGVNFDYFMGWKNITTSFIPATFTSPNYNYGFIGKISKDIALSPKVILEP